MRRSGVTEANQLRIEHDKLINGPRRSTIGRIAEALGTTYDELVDGTEYAVSRAEKQAS